MPSTDDTEDDDVFCGRGDCVPSFYFLGGSDFAKLKERSNHFFNPSPFTP